MTREMIETDLAHYSKQLGEMDAEIRRRKEEVIQLTANANSVQGVIQYLQMKFRETVTETGPGEANVNADQQSTDSGAQPTDRADSPVLD